MNLGFSEKRNLHRMALDCRCSYRVVGSGTEGEAIVKNVSGDGLLLWVRDPIEAGASLQVSIAGGGCTSGGFNALARVVRCTRAAEPGQHEVACLMVPVN